MTTIGRRMFELLEPICLVVASRTAPLGRVPAQVVHTAFYNFADGEAARHIPSAWETIPPEASVALSPAELDELQPLTAILVAAGSQ